MNDSIVENAAGGRKADAGKLRYGLIPPAALEALADVLTFGAAKYSPNNWMHVESYRYVDALYRHLEAARAGELLDPESGKTHLSHALTNLAFLVHLQVDEDESILRFDRIKE